MQSLRVVLVMIEPPLPFGNAAARWFYVLLRGLVERGHKVTALAACSKPEEIAKAKKLFPDGAYDLRCYPYPQRSGIGSKLETLRRPYSYMFSDELRADLDSELARGYDVLHLEQLWSGWLGLEHRNKSIVNVHHLVWIDLEHHATSLSKAWIDRQFMFWAERRLVRGLQNFRSCSPRLVPEILRVNPKAVVETLPVGLDMEQYPFIPDSQRTTEPVLSVIGSMDWYPSRSAAQRLMDRLWPSIKAQVPNARVQIVGWGAKRALAQYVGLPDVVIEENVPDIQPYFERTGVLLYAPGRGSGMKIKILEAMAFGIPVVTTSEGVEGLPAIDGIHAGVCEDDQGLIERAVRLLRDTSLQNRQRHAGRALVESHCGSRPTLDKLEQIYSQILNGKNGHA